MVTILSEIFYIQHIFDLLRFPIKDHFENTFTYWKTFQLNIFATYFEWNNYFLKSGVFPTVREEIRFQKAIIRAEKFTKSELMLIHKNGSMHLHIKYGCNDIVFRSLLEQRDDKLQPGSSKSICEIFSIKCICKCRLSIPNESSFFEREFEFKT